MSKISHHRETRRADEEFSGRKRVDAAAEWGGRLTGLTGSLLVFVSLSGLVIWLLPFSVFTQASVLLHTVSGVILVPPVTVYTYRHWRVRREGNLSHYQVMGYLALVFLGVCCVSGLFLTWQGVFGSRIGDVIHWLHLVTGILLPLFVVLHLVMLIVRPASGASLASGNRPAGNLAAARRRFYARSLTGLVFFMGLSAAAAAIFRAESSFVRFPEDYNWRFGAERPFAPSLARLETPDSRGGERAARGALAPGTLSGSARCGSSGCHEQIYEEWLPSAHRYSALDDLFQQVQALMAEETSPEHTRYCAGCHDPISLFSGAKNAARITLSAEGYDEGASCLVCHSIVRADVQGNADYVLRPPRRYLFEGGKGPAARLISDFLIRTYPRQHVESYSRPLYKTAEFCGACHKQYIDKEVNTDIGRVQGQNQYDSWRKSRWYHEGDPGKTITCRECHMPLQASRDPASGDVVDLNRRGDDGRHRSHRFLAANQYIPRRHDLEGAETHTALTVQWLRGEIEIPEIAEKWTTGPVVRLEIVAPPEAAPGETVPVQVTLTNNKTGHDFPTGPLDMIESWVELIVTDGEDRVIYHAGRLDPGGRADDPPVIFKAEGFDRRGDLIDRHNLWDLVGAKYKRSLFPGFTDAVHLDLACPILGATIETGSAGSRVAGFEVPAGEAGMENTLHIEAILWYRKANPEFLDRVYGRESGIRSPVTDISRAEASVRLVNAERTAHE
jgi:hypothetical protein